MTLEEVKRELKKYSEAKREHERLIRLLEEIETAISSISIDYSNPKVLSTPNADKLSDSIDRLSKVRKDCIDMAWERTTLMVWIVGVINEIEDPLLRDVLTRRYVYDHQWEKIAYELHYSWRGVHNLHGKALKECQSVMTKNG